MIETKTLLIVGAGASVPYGYPTGPQLREELCDPSKLDDLENHYKVHERGINLFCQHFKASQSVSIDAFLAKRGDDVIGKQTSGTHQTFGTYGECGKLAIACRLIEREILAKNLPEPKEDHWLQYLWNRINDVPKLEFINNQLKIISFNYDRVIEQYFQTAIEYDYGVSPDEANELRESIGIIHVYGNLQELNERAYGVKPNDLSLVADCIKVIPEARKENDKQFEKAKEMIDWADKICFIGFGFDSTNVRRLGFPNHNLLGKTIYFTQFGMTANEAHASQKLLGDSFNCYIDRNGKFTELKTLAYIRHEAVFLTL